MNGSEDLATTDYVYRRAINLGLDPVDKGHYDRWQAIKPTLETRASLAVFLYELREIKSMWEVLPKKHLTWKGKRIQSWADAIKYIGSKHDRDFDFKWINNLHLNYNFGWKPFVRDVCSVWTGLDSYERRLSRYLGGLDRELMRRFRDKPYDASYNMTTSFGPNPAYNWVEVGTREVQYASAFDFIYNSPYKSIVGSEWRTLADTLGLNANPSTIWAVVPWSFVVDWFYDISGLLKSNESDWMQTQITMLHASYSRKITGTWAVHFVHTYGGATVPEIKISFSQYIRRLGHPVFSGIGQSLDADKIRLGASLLVGRFY